MSPEMYGILGTILGVIVGAPVTYYFARILFTHQRNIEAASKFREDFLDGYIYCETPASDIDNDSVLEFLNRNESMHKKAIIRYRPFIKKSMRKDFDEACAIFISSEARRKIRFSNISGMSQEVDIQGVKETDQRGKIKEKIEYLLSFSPAE